jgi:DNA invertase Pin-like site-specific DNA recombinase
MSKIESGKVAIYIRVSSKSQDTRSQEPELASYAERERDKGKTVEFFRDSFTGKVMDRPGWSKLMAGVYSGSIDTIACWRLDRLGRTAKGLTALFDDLRVRKVNLVSLRDGVDLSTAAGRMFANILASVAQFETEVRAERIQAGQSKAMKDGKTWGGSKKGRTIKTRANDQQISLIRRLNSEGESITAIAKATGLSRPTVYSYI